MTNILDGLLGRVDDPALRHALTTEVDRLRSTKDFGLVFERHMPENVRLYSHPVRRGCRVQERATRGDTTWLVRRVNADSATLIDTDGEETTRPVEELVVIRQFGEPIHPGFRHVGSVERGGDKPHHTVINGENYHALETLLYTCEGQVDCLYIDPPYNTGAKDWKYDNDYVDDKDAYRHSKWLAFMERRLKLAKRLLNPEESVLIVTIDEKEYLRLGLLLEQVFPTAPIQMVSIVINPSGTSRDGLSRVEEYAFFVFLGSARPARTHDNLLTGDTEAAPRASLAWESLLRRGNKWYRAERPNLCYPVLVDPATQRIVGAGKPFAGEDESKRPLTIDGFDAAWPVRTDGRLGIWRKDAAGIMALVEEGHAFASSRDERRGTWTIRYLMSGTVSAIRSGTITVERSGKRGEVEPTGGDAGGAVAKTVWNRPAHNAGTHGSALLRLLIPGRRFPFPKSLYAVEDALRIAVKNKPGALVVDFFGGSGTTAHAVARLNHQDGGRRRSIVVTNNEVSDDEAKALRVSGYLPGDPEWEAQGIFQHITMPRIAAAFTGRTPEGEPVAGDYKFIDEFPMAEGFEENVQFLELSYLDRNDVSRGKAFEAIAPLLWLKVGATGDMIAKVRQPYAAPDGARYAVLFDVSHWQDFAEAVREREDLTHLFVVTDSIAQYQQVVAELPATVEVTMLYEDYLRNFEVNLGSAS
jgi:adenine-specific DNA-methyltransferase